MPWQKVDTVDLRREFVTLAKHGSCSFSELCFRYNISRKTGYKWLDRFKELGGPGLEDQSRKPRSSPKRTAKNVETLVLRVRKKYPDWGGRKIKRLLEQQGHKKIPCASTITEIIKRHGLETPEKAENNFIRFEHPYPNDLWQMDFKGDFKLSIGRCFPLTVLDDHSRFSLCLDACGNQQQKTVKTRLIETFKRYGKPRRMTMDNGSPWGCGNPDSYTQLTVWLIEQGVTVSHSRPYHPQTQGKIERFHRTLKAELLGRQVLRDMLQCQSKFKTWRNTYNTIRPHEALNLETPAEHYQPSTARYTENTESYEYGATDAVRKVGNNLVASFQRYEIFLGQAFKGKRVAIRPTQIDGQFDIYFCHQKIKDINLKASAKRQP